MSAKVIVVLCFCIAAVAAYPYQEDSYVPTNEFLRQRRDLNWQPKENKEPAVVLDGQGGGNRRDGFNVHGNSDFKVWESQNGNHQVNGQAGYSQHLGGPYGNSRPDYRGGVSYTRRFGAFGR